MFANALIVGSALLLIRFIGLEASFQHAKRSVSSIHFPVGIGLRVVFRLGAPFLMLVSFKMTQAASSHFDQAMAMLVAALGIGCLVGEPGEIIAASDGLRQRVLLGLRRKVILWEGAAASHPRGLREVLVIGLDGTTITHTQHHVGQDEFLHELERHRVHIQ